MNPCDRCGDEDLCDICTLAQLEEEVELLKTQIATKDEKIQALTTDVEQLRIYIDQIQ